MTNETRKLARFMMTFMVVVALSATTVALVTGEWWPLFLTNTMLVFAMVIAIGEGLSRDDDA